MNFRVLWLTPSETELFAQLFRSVDKREIMEAAEEIERFLATNPHEAGEGREGDVRMIFARPLCALYTIDEVERIAYVEWLQWVGK